MSSARRAAPPYLIALLLLVAAAFFPGLGGGWLFDDYPNIVQREAVHVESIDAEFAAKVVSGFGNAAGRPLAMATFALDHAVWGKDPWGYKLTSLLVHLLNALLVFALTRRLLAMAWPARAEGPAAAFAIAAIWALHPLQVSTVYYVVQRMEMLSLTFVVLALLTYLAGRRRQVAGTTAWPWLLACLPLVALGVLCKETAALFPAYALVLELTVLRFAASSPAQSRGWRIAYAAGVAAAVAVFVLWAMPRFGTAEVYAIRDYDAVDRLLTQLRVLPMYVGWIMLPQPGNYVFYYDTFPPSEGLLAPWTTLAGALVVAAMLVGAWLARRRMPLFALGILWFFAAHVLTSNVIPLELVFEHRNYFALLGIVLAGADLFFRLPASEIPRIRPFAVGVVIVGLLGLTLIRSATWGHPLNLALALVDKNPGSSRASMDLGEQYMLRARRDATSRYYVLAEREFERGARAPGASPMPEQGLIVMAATAGVPAKPEWWDSVVRKLETRAIGPQEVAMMTGLLRMRGEGVAFDDARFAEAYLVLARRLEMPATQYYAFGEHALDHLDDGRIAESLFLGAVERAEGDPEFVAAMVDALLRKGEPALARTVADRARELGIADVRMPEPAAAPEPTRRNGSDTGPEH